MTTTDPDAPGSRATAAEGIELPDAPGTGDACSRRITRASAAWVATGAALVLLVLLIVFILQNQTEVEIRFLGLDGTIPLGVAMLIAAVAGGCLVAVAGTSRVLQLRRVVRTTRNSDQ